MRFIKLSIFVFAVSVFFPLVSAQAGKIAATVNGKPILQEDVDNLMPADTSGEMQDRFREQILERLINERLLDEFFTAEGIEIDKKEFKKRMDQLQKELNLQLKIGKYLDKTVTEELLKQEFEKETKDNIRARHILAKVTDEKNDEEQKKAKEKIESVEAELKKGADFADLAQKHSECPSAQRGGDLGIFGHDTMIKEFADAAFALKIGEVSKPVKTQFGWHLIKREEVRFEEMKEGLKNNLNSKLFNDLLKELQEKAKIEKNL